MKYPLRNIAFVFLSIGVLCATPHLAVAASTSKSKGSGAAKPDPQALAEEIGSTRNAQVAIPMTGKKTELTFFANTLSKEEQAEIAKIAPNVRVVTGLSNEEALARAGEAHGIDVRYAKPDFLARANKLAWVQSSGAGVETIVYTDGIQKNDRIVLTNFRAVHGPAIADHAMGMLLSLTRDLRTYVGSQAQERWGRVGGRKGQNRQVALEGSTMLVVGLGGIGTEIAQRAHGFGMKVMATRRSNTPGPAYVERIGQSGDLLKMLPDADVVAICVPLTTETKHLFNQAAFAAMKRGSYLINIARGGIIDTNALMAALNSGHLAGACLDVTDPEPLPAGHPLWKTPNVFITPHVAQDSVVTDQRRWALLSENLRRFGAGEPLLNVVDKKAGY